MEIYIYLTRNKLRKFRNLRKSAIEISKLKRNIININSQNQAI